jgi:hypothetical protein
MSRRVATAMHFALLYWLLLACQLQRLLCRCPRYASSGSQRVGSVQFCYAEACDLADISAGC